MKNTAYSLVILTAVGIVYYNWSAWQNVLGFSPRPCSQPITYSIGSFDTHFGITPAELTSDTLKAIVVWNEAIGRTLIKYDESSPMKVNLIYDYRQQATNQQSKIDDTISNGKADFNMLKLKYEELYRQYLLDRASLQTEYDRLRHSAQVSRSDVTSYNQNSARFNKSVDTLNSTATKLNDLAKTLNVNVKTYNAVGAAVGERFDEGEYIEDDSGKRINIYEFKDENQLVRVMEHEFGHALGLDHVDDPKAIMYYMNEGTNDTLTTSDIDELKKVCNISQ